MNTRVALIDYGNVCETFNFGRFIENFCGATKVPASKIEDALFENPQDDWGHKGYSRLFQAFECGEISPVQFYFALTEFLDCRERVSFPTFASIWIDIFNGENKDLYAMLYRVQRKHLLSNTNALVYGLHMAESAIVRHHFPTQDKRILSFVVHAIKPNPAIYHAAFKQAGVPAEQTILVDDMPANVDALRALGGNGIVYNAKHDSIKDLVEQLREFGVLA